MKILDHILNSQEFRKELLLWAWFKGESATTFDTEEGKIEAFVNEASFAGAIEWKEPKRSKLKWTVEFSAECDLSLQYSTSDGEERINQVSGPCSGKAHIEFSADLLTLDEIVNIVENLDMDVDLHSYPNKT